MSQNFVNTFCATLPGAEVSDPWGGGHDCWKVGGKMFAVTGAIDKGVSVKTPDAETAEMLTESGIAERAAYMHRSWVRLPVNAPEAEVRHRIAESYRIIRKSLTKRVQAELAPVE